MPTTTRQQLLDSAKRLHTKGLTDASSLLSLRVVATGEPCFASINPSAIGKAFDKLTENDIGIWSIKNLTPVDDHSETLGKSTPQALHAQVFAERGDTGGIFVSGGTFTQALHLVKEPMAGIFDEQVRQVGLSVKKLTAKKYRLNRADKKLLANHDNAFLTGDKQALILGVTFERVVFNAELIEKFAKAYVLASATGKTVSQMPFYVKLIANKRKLSDQKRTADSYQNGEMPSGFTAY